MKQIKFLIDECLTKDLVYLARQIGYYESSRADWIGMGGCSDSKIMIEILENDWTFVTNNSKDFRPSENSKSPLYTNEPLHMGLICLDFPYGSNKGDQIKYFQYALNEIEKQHLDMINILIEVFPDKNYKNRILTKIKNIPENIF